MSAVAPQPDRAGAPQALRQDGTQADTRMKVARSGHRTQGRDQEASEMGGGTGNGI